MRQSLARSAALILLASALGGCANYDYLQHTDRISYHAGDAVQGESRARDDQPVERLDVRHDRPGQERIGDTAGDDVDDHHRRRRGAGIAADQPDDVDQSSLDQNVRQERQACGRTAPLRFIALASIFRLLATTGLCGSSWLALRRLVSAVAVSPRSR